MQEIFELYKKYNITYNDAMDDMTKIVIKGMDNYNNNIDFIKKLKKDHKSSKNIRKPNFPEYVSEPMICLTIRKHLPVINQEKYKNETPEDICIMPSTGDLYSKIDGKLECKCFASDGPISFGPTEKWDKLYILNATSADKNNFILYEIDINSNNFGSIKISKTETFAMKCAKTVGQRPRINWKELEQQIPHDKIKIIAKGTLSELIN